MFALCNKSPPPQWRHQVGPFVGQALRGVPGPAAPHRPSELRGPQPCQPRDDGHRQRRQEGQGTDMCLAANKFSIHPNNN